MLTREKIYFEADSVSGTLPAHGWGVEGIFCLNPDNATDRWEHMTAQFEAQSSEFPVMRVRGPRYTQEELLEAYHHSDFSPPWDNSDPPIMWDIHPNVMNCSLGHLRALAQAKRMGLKTILMLEDDVILNLNLKDELINCIAELNEVNPEWESCNFSNPNGVGECSEWYDATVIYTDHLTNGDGIWGAGAILYSERGMDRLLANSGGVAQMAAWDMATFHLPQAYAYAWKLMKPRAEQAVLYYKLNAEGLCIRENLFQSIIGFGC